MNLFFRAGLIDLRRSELGLGGRGAVPLRGLDLSLSSSHAGNNYRNPLYPPDRLAQTWRRTLGPSKVLKIECVLASFFERFKKKWRRIGMTIFLGRDSMRMEGTADPHSASLRAGSPMRSVEKQFQDEPAELQIRSPALCRNISRKTPAVLILPMPLGAFRPPKPENRICRGTHLMVTSTSSRAL
jgi:hypothetical protein